MEEIVHGVEKVAEVVEKVAEEISENLPAGKLKDAVELVEHVAEKADKDAEALGEFIDKVILLFICIPLDSNISLQ